MATPQKLIYGTWTQSVAPLAIASLAGLGLGQAWDFDAVATSHGGLAFVLAWLLCMALLALPLRLLEIMLGRRSRRGLIEGMAFLTREADAPRYWRAAAWGGLLATLPVMTGLALLAGWGFSFFGHRLLNPVIYTAHNAGLEWPLATGGALLIAGLLSWLGMVRAASIHLVASAVVLLLLIGADVPGVVAAGPVLQSFNGPPLTASGWIEAARIALLSVGGGLGVLWLVGAYLPPARRPGGVALPAVLVQILLTLMVGLGVAPVAQLAATLPGSSLIYEQLPAALTNRSTLALPLFSALGICAIAALAVVGEVGKLFLKERGLKGITAVLLTFALPAVAAEGIWFGGASALAHGLLTGSRLLLLLVLLVLTVYGGWVMKISHARKELELPSEALYNLWRVAVRILCPLVIILVLVASL